MRLQVLGLREIAEAGELPSPVTGILKVAGALVALALVSYGLAIAWRR